MKHLIPSTALAVIVAVAPLGASAEAKLERKTPACQLDENGCYTVDVSEPAPLSMLLEGGAATLMSFSTENGYETPLTGNEVIQEGKFTFRL